MKEWRIKSTKCEDALAKLDLALAQPPEDELTIDGTVKRFEFTFEMFKNLFHSILEYQDIKRKSPLLEEAYKANLIKNDKIWQQMRADRNDTSHEYNEEKAQEIYNRIPEYFDEFTNILNTIKSL